MAKTLGNLLLDGYIDLGLANEPFLATGGSSSTIENSLYASDEEPPLEDFAKRWTAFVEHDAAGAGAAPQGEYQRISAYDEANYRFTTDAFTAAVASGDRIVIVSDLVPLQQMIVMANEVISDLGRLELVDTSLTTAANQTEYTLPLGITKENLYAVEIQRITTDANDNRWAPVKYDVIPAAAGTAHTLIIAQYAAGYKLQLWYRDFHAKLTAYNSTISPTLQYAQIKAAFRYKITDWYNQRNEGGDEFWLGAERKAAGLLDLAKIEHPQRAPAIRNKTFDFGKGIASDEFPPIELA